MKKRSTEVLVVDSEKRFLEYTRPALARKYLKEGKAKIFSKNPFAIMLLHSKPITSIRRIKMSRTIRNFTEHFREERDVYVQNIAGAQISLEFQLGQGRVEGFCFTNNRDPINLTQHIPFNAIKESMDFRKMLSRRPPALLLLEEEEYTAYYSARAKSAGILNDDGEPNVDAAMDLAEERRLRLSDKSMRENVASSRPDPIHTVTETGSGPGGAKRFGERERVSHDDMVAEEEVITPRVLHLCNQVKGELSEEERMSAASLIEELQSLGPLSLDDLEHVRAHGYYKTTKKWAKMEMERLIVSSEEADEGAED